jgi:hydroxymethylglutaryl-CoA synthase
MLGFGRDQLAPGLLVGKIGNVYAGSSLIGLTGILDVAEPGDRILMVSYGSGAGSDAFDLVVTDKLLDRRNRAPFTQDYVRRRTEVDYAIYTRYRRKLKM